MFIVLDFIIDIFGTIFSWFINLQIPNGNGGYITYKTLILFLILTSLAWQVLKMFLSKGHLNRNGKD